MIYGRRGEPYRIKGHTLSLVPGTRAVRIKYANSATAISHYDALQVQLFSDEVAEGDTAMGNGVHAGQYCILMSAICGHGDRVVTFEADSYAQEYLYKNLSEP